MSKETYSILGQSILCYHSNGINISYSIHYILSSNMYYIELLSSISYCLSPSRWTTTQIRRAGYFQQDDAPSFYDLTVRAYLDHTFPGQWIGRTGPLRWPPQSPDLTPCDYWLWGMVKERVYGRRVNDINELKGCDINYSPWNVCAGFKCYC